MRLEEFGLDGVLSDGPGTTKFWTRHYCPSTLPVSGSLS
jgi:hypothetical protein